MESKTSSTHVTKLTFHKEQAQQQVKQKKERKKAKQADNFVEGEEEAEDDNYNNDGETPSAYVHTMKLF